jgi:hypothetical protein
MIFIFLNAGPAKTEEADLIEGYRQEQQNCKDNLNGSGQYPLYDKEKL